MMSTLTKSYSPKERSRSDLLSGLIPPSCHSLDHGFSEGELLAHYERFKAYDLDDSGFISLDNLKSILSALEIPNTDEMVANMLEEVAILSGHQNDGALSFRDYIRILEYESKAEAFNVAIDAALERREGTELADFDAAQPVGEELEAEQTTVREAEAEALVEPAQRMRRSSLAALDMITRGRIAKFEQVIDKTVKSVRVDDAAARSEARFAAKLAKFQRPAASETAVAVENLYKRSVKDKLHAFESANRAAPSQVDFHKTWKKLGHGSWKQKTQVAGAPPPKRSLLELP